MNRPQLRQFFRQKIRPTATNADVIGALDALADFAALQPGGGTITPTTPQEIVLLGTEPVNFSEVVTKIAAALAALSAAPGTGPGPAPAPTPDPTPTPTPGTPTAAGAYPAAYLENY